MLPVEQIHVGLVTQSLLQVTCQRRVRVVARTEPPTQRAGSPNPHLGDGDLVVSARRHTGASRLDLNYLDPMTPVP